MSYVKLKVEDMNHVKYDVQCVKPFVVSFVGLLILCNVWTAYYSYIYFKTAYLKMVISLSAFINILSPFYYSMLSVCTSCYVKLPRANGFRMHIHLFVYLLC